MRPLHEQFVITAKRMGNKPALIDRFTEKGYSYDKLLVAALLFARRVAKEPEGVIGIMLPTSAGCMLSILGVVMAGKVPAMINYATNAAENCEYAQRKCGFRTIITSRALLEKLGCRQVRGMVLIEDLAAEIGTLAKLRMALRCQLPTRVLLRLLPRVNVDDTVVILFTSGSEKDPKAVQLTHRNLGSNIADIIPTLGARSNDVILANLPLFHVFGHNICFWLPLLLGATAVSYPNPLEYRTICQILRDQKVTIMVGTPTFFHGYLRQSQGGDFDTVRICVSGADKLPEALRLAYWDRHRIELCEGYGATETSPVVSTNRPGAHKPGSIGMPLPSVQVRIADLKTGETLPLGAEGKILVKGELVMKGYFDDLEETSLHIKNGWYDTGDMGMFDKDGYLWHRGRLKRFVKIGGEMISLVKVESVLAEVVGDETIECCVVELPDSYKGARIVAVTTRKLDVRQVTRKMAEKLPPIAMPREFLVFETLPKMGSGKIDFRSITDMVRKRVQPG
jgi:acyl-[acyl-carrier-protein]-phospholipid O-acyltransferase/long-chain-fatty-acid--[acyl-carrier-protein] ligase